MDEHIKPSLPRFRLLKDFGVFKSFYELVNDLLLNDYSQVAQLLTVTSSHNQHYPWDKPFAEGKRIKTYFCSTGIQNTTRVINYKNCIKYRVYFFHFPRQFFMGRIGESTKMNLSFTIAVAFSFNVSQQSSPSSSVTACSAAFQ